MRITIQGERAEMATGLYCQLTKWGRGRPKGATPGARQLFYALQSLRAQATLAHWDAAGRGEQLQAAQIKAALTGKDTIKHSRETRPDKSQELNFGED